MSLRRQPDHVHGRGQARDDAGSPTGYMTIAETARYSRLSERQIRKFLALPPSQALPCYRPGRRVLVQRVEFDGWFAQYRARGKPVVARVLRELGLDPERLTGDPAARPGRLQRSAGG